MCHAKLICKIHTLFLLISTVPEIGASPLISTAPLNAKPIKNINILASPKPRSTWNKYKSSGTMNILFTSTQTIQCGAWTHQALIFYIIKTDLYEGLLFIT